MSLLRALETARPEALKGNGSVCLFLLRVWIGIALLMGLTFPARGGDFQVQVYTSANPPLTPMLKALPLLNQITQDGINWTFSQPQRMGRFVNGDVIHSHQESQMSQVGLVPP